MRSILLVLMGWLSIGLAAVQAAVPANQPMVDALTRATAAVVGVRVTATPGSRSAETLGRERVGSGVVIGADGLVLTIGYLVVEAENIQIVTQDNKILPARTVGYDLATGFGLLRPLLPMRGIVPVPLGNGGTVAEGEPLMAVIGGEDGGAALTRLAGKRPFSGYWEYHIDTALFTSPPVGNHSGAPLFNQRGELLGIGSLFVANAAGGDRQLPGNMFVPVDLLKPILAELQQSGTSKQSRRPWLGLTSSEAGGQVRVVRVSKDGPAEAAGLRGGDVVMAIDGVPVGTLEAFYKKLWAAPQPDADIRLTVQRAGEVRTVTVKAVDRLTTMAKPAGI
jgi:serine protease Do